MKFLGGISALALTIIVGQGANAANATCIPQAEMQTIAQAFSQFANIANADYCYDGSQTAHLIEAIEFMRHTQYATSMPKSTDQLFSGFIANDWWGYFTKRISDLEVEASCPQGVGAFVYGFGGHTMYICPMLLTDSFSSVDRVSVMMHEARHIDGYAHIECDHGARAGIQGACDNRITDDGSYTVTVETYSQMGAYATGLSAALKAYSAASAVVYADEAFEVQPQINRTPDFLLMSTNKELYKLPADGSTNLKRLGDAPALGHIVKRAQFMILVPDDKTLPAKYLFDENEGTIPQDAGTTAADYNSKTPAQRAEMVDMHIGAQWTARVYNTHITFTCDPTSPDENDVAINSKPAALIYPNGYDRAVESAELLMEDGSIQEIGCRSRAPYVQLSNLKLDQNYKRVYKVSDEILGLRADGRLFVLNGVSSSAPLQTSLDGRVYEIAPIEGFQFFGSN